MIAKLAAKDSGRTRQLNLNPKYIKVEIEVKIEVTVREIIRIGIGQIIDQTVETEDNSGKTEADSDLSKNYRRNNFRENSGNYGIQNSRGEYRNNNYRNDRSRNKSRERLYSRSYDSNRTRSTSSSRSRSGSGASINKDRIRCYKCREYDHLMRDCPTTQGRKRNRTTSTYAHFGRRSYLPVNKCTKWFRRKSKSKSFKPYEW